MLKLFDAAMKEVFLRAGGAVDAIGYLPETGNSILH
jgi:hypothetical protein